MLSLARLLSSCTNFETNEHTTTDKSGKYLSQTIPEKLVKVPRDHLPSSQSPQDFPSSSSFFITTLSDPNEASSSSAFAGSILSVKLKLSV
jgi:hypothetical protein